MYKYVYVQLFRICTNCFNVSELDDRYEKGLNLLFQKYFEARRRTTFDELDKFMFFPFGDEVRLIC